MPDCHSTAFRRSGAETTRFVFISNAASSSATRLFRDALFVEFATIFGFGLVDVEDSELLLVFTLEFALEFVLEFALELLLEFVDTLDVVVVSDGDIGSALLVELVLSVEVVLLSVSAISTSTFWF